MTPLYTLEITFIIFIFSFINSRECVCFFMRKHFLYEKLICNKLMTRTRNKNQVRLISRKHLYSVGE